MAERWLDPARLWEEIVRLHRENHETVRFIDPAAPNEKGKVRVITVADHAETRPRWEPGSVFRDAS